MASLDDLIPRDPQFREDIGGELSQLLEKLGDLPREQGREEIKVSIRVLEKAKKRFFDDPYEYADELGQLLEKLGDLPRQQGREVIKVSIEVLEKAKKRFFDDPYE